MTDEPTNPASDEQSVFANAANPQLADRPQPSTLTIEAKPLSKDHLRSLVDVLSADLRRAIKKPLKPADVELLGRVADRAARLAIETRLTPPDAGEKALKKLDAKRRQVESQLAGIKSIGSSLAAKRFWALVDAAIDRLVSFAVTTAVAAL